MLGVQTEIKLANLFKTVADGEKQVEVTRQVLAEQRDFEPYTAFKRIDRLSNGYLGIYDLHKFLRENDIYVTERDVKNLIKLYDSNADDRLSYTDFLNLVLPNTSPALRKICTQRSSYYVSKYEPLPYEAEWALARVINKEIDFFRKIELLKEDLVSRYDFTTLDAFKIIDADRLGYINHDSIYYFLKRNGMFVTDDDVLAILREIDIDGTGRITYADFVDAILPLDPYYRLSYKPMTTIIDPPIQRSASPLRRTRLSATNFYSPSKRLSNLDYYDYLTQSTRKSPLRGRSPSRLTYTAYSPSRLSPSRADILEVERDIALTKSMYQTPTKTRLSVSPSRLSSSKKVLSSPMKGNEEEHLAIALKENINNDRDLESLKNEISLKVDFNLLDAFRFFDISGKGYITRGELEDGLKEFGVFPTSTELYLIMRKFDSDNDSLLKYTDFCEMVTPKSPEYADILTKRVPTYADQENLDLIFSYDTKKSFGRLLNNIIQNEVNNEALRQKLNRRPLFNVYEAFKALDKNDIGFANLEEFKELLLDHGIYATTKDLANLVQRYDKNQDGKVTYSDFVQEITPKSPSKIY
jgi:Ca2+-binding EF-hand superfamily protein